MKTLDGNEATRIFLDINDTSDDHAIVDLSKTEYILIRTEAPHDYDAFGTITLAEFSEFELGAKPKMVRYVLQPVLHAEYFIGRCRSGLFGTSYSAEFSAHAIWDTLYKRLFKMEM